MPSYRPRQYADIFKTNLGRALWRFLNRNANVLRMEVASDLRHPAVAGVDRAILAEFGASVRSPRKRQMIGHMVRQIMERRGFQLDAQRVNVLTGDLFVTGSRYRRPAVRSRQAKTEVSRSKRVTTARRLHFVKGGR